MSESWKKLPNIDVDIPMPKTTPPRTATRAQELRRLLLEVRAGKWDDRPLGGALSERY